VRGFPMLLTSGEWELHCSGKLAAVLLSNAAGHHLSWGRMGSGLGLCSKVTVNLS
jgi:hypothetical protein